MRWFVSRHPGAVEWLTEQGLEVDRMIAHLDIRQIQPGDWVLGTLPVSLAAEVCARGARYVHLHVPVPAALRGQELTAQQMREVGARWSVYQVTECEPDAGTE